MLRPQPGKSPVIRVSSDRLLILHIVRISQLNISRVAHTIVSLSFLTDAQHGFTKWGPAPRYDAMADSRSWWSMMSLIDTLSEQNDSSMAGENMEEAGDDADDMSEGEADKMRSSAHWYNISGSFRFALMVFFFSVAF